jgi:hypothetical protein
MANSFTEAPKMQKYFRNFGKNENCKNQNFILLHNPEPGLEIFSINLFLSGGSVISHVNGIFLTLAALATII